MKAARPGGSAAAPPALEELSAAVVCGGRSSRYGSDKATARVSGRTLLERALDSLVDARERLVVGRAYAVEGARFVPDRRPGLGPLAGLEAALEAATGSWLALAACDMPCLTPAYWRLLCAHASGCQVVIVRDPGGRLEPLAALYHRSVLGEVGVRLDAGTLSMRELVAAVPAREIDAAAVVAACGPGVLRNVNRPGDLEALERDGCGS